MPTRTHILFWAFIFTVIACGTAAVFHIPGSDRACIGFTFVLALREILTYLERFPPRRP